MLRLWQEPLAKSRQPHAAGITREQAFSQFAFQLGNHACNHLRGNGAAYGRLAKLERLGDDSEIA